MDNTIGTIGAAPDATITASYLRYGSEVDMTELVDVLSQRIPLRRRQQQLGVFFRRSPTISTTTIFPEFAEQLAECGDQRT